MRVSSVIRIVGSTVVIFIPMYVTSDSYQTIKVLIIVQLKESSGLEL